MRTDRGFDKSNRKVDVHGARFPVFLTSQRRIIARYLYLSVRSPVQLLTLGQGLFRVRLTIFSGYRERNRAFPVHFFRQSTRYPIFVTRPSRFTFHTFVIYYVGFVWCVYIFIKYSRGGYNLFSQHANHILVGRPNVRGCKQPFVPTIMRSRVLVNKGFFSIKINQFCFRTVTSNKGFTRCSE